MNLEAVVINGKKYKVPENTSFYKAKFYITLVYKLNYYQCEINDSRMDGNFLTIDDNQENFISVINNLIKKNGNFEIKLTTKDNQEIKVNIKKIKKI